MSDPLEPMARGDHSPFLTSFNTVNTALRLLNQQRQRERGRLHSSREAADLNPTCRVWVKNLTGATLPPLSVVKLGEPLISAVDHTFTVLKGPLFRGETPDAPDNTFAITEDGCDAGSEKLVRAVVLGVVPCRVNVTDADHAFAEPFAGSVSVLASAPYGPARIVWKASGTGSVRAVVQLTDDALEFPAELTSVYDTISSPSTGYAWSRQWMSGVTLSTSSPGLSGTRAFEISGNQVLPIGTKVLLRKTGTRYEFFHPLLSEVAPLTSGVGWLKVATKTFADLAVASPTNQINIYSLPARMAIHGAVLKHTVAFGGGGILSYDVGVGISGSAFRYIKSSDVFTAPGDAIFSANGGLAPIPTPENFGSATWITLFADSGAVNLNAATTGSVDIWLCLGKLPA